MGVNLHQCPAYGKERQRIQVPDRQIRPTFNLSRFNLKANNMFDCCNSTTGDCTITHNILIMSDSMENGKQHRGMYKNDASEDGTG